MFKMGTKIADSVYTQVLGGAMKDLIVSIGIGFATGIMFTYSFKSVSIGIAMGFMWAVVYNIIFGNLKAKDDDNK